jgi:hypothetical protein
MKHWEREWRSAPSLVLLPRFPESYAYHVVHIVRNDSPMYYSAGSLLADVVEGCRDKAVNISTCCQAKSNDVSCIIDPGRIEQGIKR